MSFSAGVAVGMAAGIVATFACLAMFTGRATDRDRRRP